MLEERALAKARARRRGARRRRSRRPALAGVPVAIKDVLDIEGLPTTCGSRILEGYRPPFTATAVARLEAAGAVVIGKTNMDEFAMGSSTENSAYKKTRNPWDPSRVPGGSSGGSAAAVAAGMAPLALGTDTGGSIRQPAALLRRRRPEAHLRPREPLRPGGLRLVPRPDRPARPQRGGRRPRSPRSSAASDPLDATSAAAPVPDFAAALDRRGPRTRASASPGASWRRASTRAQLAASARRSACSRSAGARLVEVELPHVPHAIATYYIVATAEASSNLARFDGVRYGLRAPAPADLRRLYGDTRDLGFGPEVKRRIILGTFVLSSGYYDAYYLRAQKVRTLIRRDFERAFERCDVVATPTSPVPAFRLGEKTDDPLQMYLADIFTVPANLAGIPGLSVPCGFAAGLPVGLQLLGRPFDEASLLAARRGLPGRHRSPPAVAAALTKVAGLERGPAPLAGSMRSTK